MKKVALVVCLMFMAFMMSACGGGGGSDPDTNPQVLSGQFVDAPVEGLSYTSGTTTGKTTANGIFQYESGKTVTFKVGDIVLGTSQGKAIVTPLDLARYAKNDQNIPANDQMVVNIVRFLMTVTGSNTNSQTFTIDQTTYNNCLGKTVNFDQATGAFTIPNGITENSLISVGDAETHFNNILGLTPPETKFSSAYLNGKTLFLVYSGLKETYKFTSSNEGVGDGSNFIINPTEYTFSYTVDSNGVLQMNFGAPYSYTGFFKIINKNADRLDVCWGDTYTEASSCLVANEYLYFDMNAAQDFFDGTDPVVTDPVVTDPVATETKLTSAYLNEKILYALNVYDYDNNPETISVIEKSTLKFDTETTGVGDLTYLTTTPSEFTFSYLIDSNGILVINYIGGTDPQYTPYLKLIEKTPDYLSICWEAGYADAINCTVGNNYLFFDKVVADKFVTDHP